MMMMVRKLIMECLMALATNTSSFRPSTIKVKNHVNHICVKIISMLHQNKELTLTNS